MTNPNQPEPANDRERARGELRQRSTELTDAIGQFTQALFTSFRHELSDERLRDFREEANRFGQRLNAVVEDVSERLREEDWARRRQDLQSRADTLAQQLNRVSESVVRTVREEITPERREQFVTEARQAADRLNQFVEEVSQRLDKGRRQTGASQNEPPAAPSSTPELPSQGQLPPPDER